MIFRIASAHEEGGERVFSVNTECFLGDDDGNLSGLARPRGRECRRRPASRRSRAPTSSFECDLVFLAMGFTGAQQRGRCSSSSASSSTPGATSPATTTGPPTSPGVFVAGDMGRGQSLIVWAIAEGRSCAAAVDRHLMGTTDLPSPITPDAVSLR